MRLRHVGLSLRQFWLVLRLVYQVQQCSVLPAVDVHVRLPLQLLQFLVQLLVRVLPLVLLEHVLDRFEKPPEHVWLHLIQVQVYRSLVQLLAGSHFELVLHF